MKLRMFIIFAIFNLSCSVAQADERFTQSYAIDNAQLIEASNGVIVELRQGAPASLTAEATREALKRVTVDVRGNRLVLRAKHKKGFLGFFNSGGDDQVVFRVQVPHPKGLTLAGSSRAIVSDIESNTFTMNLSGSSNAAFSRLLIEKLVLRNSGASKTAIEQFEGGYMNASLSGSSKVAISDPSQATKLDLNVSGASKFHGHSLIVKEAKVDASGASKAEVAARQHLDISTSGASSVSYAGEPRIRHSASGASKVQSVGH